MPCGVRRSWILHRSPPKLEAFLVRQVGKYEKWGLQTALPCSPTNTFHVMSIKTLSPYTHLSMSLTGLQMHHMSRPDLGRGGVVLTRFLYFMEQSVEWNASSYVNFKQYLWKQTGGVTHRDQEWAIWLPACCRGPRYSQTANPTGCHSLEGSFAHLPYWRMSEEEDRKWANKIVNATQDAGTKICDVGVRRGRKQVDRAKDKQRNVVRRRWIQRSERRSAEKHPEA